MNRRFGLILLLILTGCATPNVWNPERLEQWSDDRWEQTLDPLISDFSSRDEVRILVFGDSGKQKTFSKTTPHIKYACEQLKCDLALMLGDNFYLFGPASADHSHFETRFYGPLEGNLPDGFDVWGVPGNHGYWGIPVIYQSDPIAQLSHTYSNRPKYGPDWLMPAHFYSIPRLPRWLHIVGFDSQWVTEPRHFEGGDDDFRARSGEYLQNVSEELAQKAGWRVLFGHHPLLTTGDHVQDEDEVLPLRRHFEDKGNFHVYFAGHDHDQQVIETKSFIQIVQGAASKERKDTWPDERREKEYARLVSTNAYWKALQPTVAFCSHMGFGIATFSESKFDYVIFAISEKGELLKKGAWTWTRDTGDAVMANFVEKVPSIENLCVAEET